MAIAQLTADRTSLPLDLIEQIALQRDWSYERAHDDELVVFVEGTWCDYQLSLNWRGDIESLHIACAFDLSVPQSRQNEIYRLLARINEQMWIGHFDLWSDDGAIMFRHALLLNGAEAGQAQVDALIAAALENCELYYQAFQFVIWAGKNASDALAATMFETRGQA